MKKFGIVAMLLAFAAGCGGKGDELISEYKKITSEMCACKDEACADKVKEKEGALEEKAGKMFADKKDVPKELIEKWEKVEDEFNACRRKAKSGGE